MSGERLILASKSAARRAMLEAAGVPYDEIKLVHANDRLGALLNGEEIARWRDTGAAGWVDRTRTLMLPGVLCHPMATWLAFRFAQTGGPPPAQAPGFSVRAVTFRADPAADAAR